MLAIAMAFLVANTVGGHTPHHKRHHVHMKEVCSPPALNRYHPVKVSLSIDPIGLADDSPSALASVRQQVKATSGLANKLAGFVIVYTGNGETGNYALAVDRYIKRVLNGPGDLHFLFHNAAYLKEQLLGAPPTQAQLDIYLFEKQKCNAVPARPTKPGG
jgi:hypothetical protein